MNKRSQQILLAVGLVVLFLTVSATFGMAVGGVLLVSAVLFLGVINVLQGSSTDAADASIVVSSSLSTHKRLRVAIIIIWACVFLVGAGALSLYFLTREFTVSLVDEYSLPIDDADLRANFGGSERTIEVNHGRGIVSYYDFSAPRAITLTISYRGRRRIVTHRRTGVDFEDITIPLFSGREVVGVTHITAEGMSIDAFLRGDLPPDLAARYPHVIILRNEVYSRARQFIDIYAEFNGSGLKYERADEGGPPTPTYSAEVGHGGEGDANLRSYFERARRLRAPETMRVEVALNMSSDILGHPLDAPLPSGFRLRLLQADNWYVGDEGVPDPSTSAWLDAAARPIGRTARGSVAISLEGLISGVELAQLLESARSASTVPALGQSARTYLDFLIRSGAPEGLIGATFHFDTRACGDADLEPHIALQLPRPEMRVTLLKNTSEHPLRIQEILSRTRSGGALWRMGNAPIAHRVTRSEFDILAPGEAILIPRWIGIRAIYTDDEVASFQIPDAGILTRFSIVPRQDEYTNYGSGYASRISMMPRNLSIHSSRIRVGPTANERAWTSDRLIDQRHPGALYAIGPIIEDINYVVNGVRLRVRHDTGSVISMIGTWETGSCPFVFAHRRGAAPLNIGTIITDRMGPAAAGRETIHIPGGTERIELRELEDEISYIDAAALIVIRNRQRRRIPALNRVISTEDGQHAVLRRGDRLWLDFDYLPRDGDRVWLEVSGYYEPVRGGRF